jgi:hypothetical protein
MTSPVEAGWRLGMPLAEVSETTTPIKSVGARILIFLCFRLQTKFKTGSLKCSNK